MHTTTNTPDPTDKEEDILRQIAKNSFGHRHESRFLKWIKEAVISLKEVLDEEVIEGWQSWRPEEWRLHIIQEHPFISPEVRKELEEFLLEFGFDSNEEYCELIASVGYDHYGMAHSGWNGVYEFCGWYLLTGSDYLEGPYDEKEGLLSILNTEDPRHEVYWSEYAN